MKLDLTSQGKDLGIGELNWQPNQVLVSLSLLGSSQVKKSRLMKSKIQVLKLNLVRIRSRHVAVVITGNNLD